ncbi:unnamed protein product, partial [marine sediment metagenome]
RPDDMSRPSRIILEPAAAAGYTFDGPDIVAQTGTDAVPFNFNENAEGNVDSRFSTTGGAYALASGSDALQTGLTVNATTGNIEGTPTEVAVRNIIIQGDDGAVTAIFSVLLQASLIPEIATGSPTPTFARTSEATVVDYLGIVRTVADGVPRFLGARLDPDNTTYHTTRIDGTTPIDENDFYADADGPYGYMSESSQTNYFTYSEEFDNADWIKGSITVTPDSTTSPDGTVNATLLDEGTSSNFHRVYQDITV